jgi:hypothetical protein
MPTKTKTADVDEDYIAQLEEENAYNRSALDQIAGMARVVGDDATDEQLQSALDEIFNLAVPDDEDDDAAAPDDEFEDGSLASESFDEEDED